MKRAFSIGPILLLVSLINNSAYGQTGYPLQPVSGADGVFETVEMNGETVYRSKATQDGYHFYMYFTTDTDLPQQTVYLEVTYLDIGFGHIGIDYNSADRDYERTDDGYNNFVFGSAEKRTAVFELTNANFRKAQNLETDLRLSTDRSLQMHILSATVYLKPTALFLMYDENLAIPYEGPQYTGDHLVNSNSLIGKVICGYQGWFRAAGDLAGMGWDHYGNEDFSDLTVEMWPDMLEYSQEEKYPVPGWTHEDGSQAYLFSSANKRTVLRHFQWMEAYGIDGAAIQRFIGGENLNLPKETFRIPAYAREAANRTGRTYYIMYDMSGCDTTLLVDILKTDWQFFIDSMKITDDDRYLHHEGKPVVGIFGFYRDRFSAKLAQEVLDVFQNEGPYEAFIAGSGQWWVNRVEAPVWLEVFDRMDAWIPWNVGNYNGDYAETSYWSDDQLYFDSAGVLYMPLIFPGFSWDNLKDNPPGTTHKSRLKGEFMWKQFLEARQLDAQAVYIAMYDEIDEGTAIFKVTNDIPVNHYLIDLEGLNSDFYLLLAGEGTRIIRNEISVPQEMPDFKLRSQPPIPDLIHPKTGDTIVSPFQLEWSSIQHTSGITGYELDIDDQLSSYTQNSTELFFEDGESSIRVRAINGLGNPGGWSEKITIMVNNSLSIPDMDGSSTKSVQLMQNYPNPVNNTTTIPFSIAAPNRVKLEIINMDGRPVATLIDTYMNPGLHQANFTFSELPGGIYLYRLITGSSVSTRKMTLIK